MEKREAIIDAMLDLVVERGFHNAPMSLVSKRAGVSAGVIYHYFASKEEIIHAVFMRFRHLKRRLLLDDFDVNAPLKQSYCKVFVKAYGFYRSHRREAQFFELYTNSTFCNPDSDYYKNAEDIPEVGEDPEKVAASARARKIFMESFRQRSEGGLLKDLPRNALHEFSWGMAFRLAKDETLLAADVLEKIAEASWDAISAD